MDAMTTPGTTKPGAGSGSDLARHWALDPGIVFLNHGSFGACPSAVLGAQQELRMRLERQPVQFFGRELQGLIDGARGRLAAFLGADADGLVPVPNATTGVNAVLRSLEIGPGDELLTTDHEYNACRNTLEFVAGRAGASVVVARIPFPLSSPDDVVESLCSAATTRTRLALVDNVTSPTGMVLPVGGIVRRLADRGIDTLVDGAHAPGMMPLDLEALGAAYYVGNCHKWLCAPKGAGFLYVGSPARRETVRPVAISHGANRRRPGRSRFHDEFDWTGTDDPTAFLCVPAAIDFMGSLLPGGWPEVFERNRRLALFARGRLMDALGIGAPCPESMIGSLASVPLPDGAPGAVKSAADTDPMQSALMRDHRIEVPVFCWPGPPKRVLRLSAQLYNDEQQYRLLASAVRDELGR